MIKCNNCGQELPEEAMFCLKCGTKVEKKLFCMSCGKELPVGAEFCMYCGKALDIQDSSKEEFEEDDDDIFGENDDSDTVDEADNSFEDEFDDFLYEGEYSQIFDEAIETLKNAGASVLKYMDGMVVLEFDSLIYVVSADTFEIDLKDTDTSKKWLDFKASPDMETLLAVGIKNALVTAGNQWLWMTDRVNDGVFYTDGEQFDSDLEDDSFMVYFRSFDRDRFLECYKGRVMQLQNGAVRVSVSGEDGSLYLFDNFGDLLYQRVCEPAGYYFFCSDKFGMSVIQAEDQAISTSTYLFNLSGWDELFPDYKKAGNANVVRMIRNDEVMYLIGYPPENIDIFVNYDGVFFIPLEGNEMQYAEDDIKKEWDKDDNETEWDNVSSIGNESLVKPEKISELLPGVEADKEGVILDWDDEFDDDVELTKSNSSEINEEREIDLDDIDITKPVIPNPVNGEANVVPSGEDCDDKIDPELEKAEPELWKKELPKVKEIEYTKIRDTVHVSKEEYKYKGTQRVRFVVEKDSKAMFSFIPEFEVDSFYPAWIWKDRVWMIGCQGRYSFDKQYFLCVIKVNGKKVQKIAEDLNNDDVDAYYRPDNDDELMFVNRKTGEFLWYNLKTKERRHLATEICCNELDEILESVFDRLFEEDSVSLKKQKERDKRENEERKEQNLHQGYHVYDDGRILINEEYLFDKDGEKEAIRDYLNCETILDACKKYYFEKLFIKGEDLRLEKIDSISIKRVTTDFQNDVRIKISDIDPWEVIVPIGCHVARYDGKELSLDYDNALSADELMEKFPDLKTIIDGLRKDLTLGYAIGEEDVAVGYVYGGNSTEYLLACTYASGRYLGFFNFIDSRLELVEIKPKENGAAISELVAAFNQGRTYEKPDVKIRVSKDDLDKRYSIDKSGFDVMTVIGQGLTAFIKNKMKVDSKDYDKDTFFTTDDLKRRISHCAGLLTEGLIHYAYPPKDRNGEKIDSEEIKGALIIAYIKELGVDKEMLVYYSRNNPNMVKVCENVPWIKNRQDWWDRIKDTFRVIEVPAMATENDAAVIVPSLNPSDGVKFNGLHEGCVGGNISITRRFDDTVYSGKDIDPMEQVYFHNPLIVEFDGRLWGKVKHPSYPELRAGVCCDDGFLYATKKGAFFSNTSGKTCRLVESDNVCGLKYVADNREIKVFLFVGLQQYEYYQRYDTSLYLSEEWLDKYHTKVEIKSFSYDDVIQFLRNMA